jgi:MFS transporter, OFA family, oxalate/formate antiporter
LLYLGYGVVGGSGLGLGYAAPVTTVAKWFPDRKGLATGMVIMGFGLGALLMSKVLAPWLYRASEGNLVVVFAWLGVGFTVATVAMASLLRSPPADVALATDAARSDSAPWRAGDPTVMADLLSFRFAALWIMFVLNSLAGISVISFQSPLLQGLWRDIDADLSPETLAAYGATLIGASSLCNGAGRLCWGGLSDRIGRAWTFRIMLASQIAVFAVLPLVGDPRLFGAMVCYILLCYGGGSGTIPSFVHDVFGARRMAVLYGVMLTASSAAGIAGPQIVAYFRDHYAEHVAGYAFPVNAGVLAVGLLFAMLLNDRAPERTGA